MSNFLLIYETGTVEQIDTITEKIIEKSSEGCFGIIDIRNKQPQQMLHGEWRGVNGYRGADNE